MWMRFVCVDVISLNGHYRYRCLLAVGLVASMVCFVPTLCLARILLDKAGLM